MTPGLHYQFGRFRLDADGRLLFRNEKRIQLTPKAVDVLLTLVERRGTAVPRQELLLRVWSDAVVEEGTLTSHISLLRKVLGRQFIETISKRGYRFVGKVEEVQRQPAASPAARVLLAVLPFENLSGSRKYDSFSDGLTEEMITQLGRLNPGRLGVIARTSAMTYKSTDKTIEQIGRELVVSHVLEGSARRAGSRVRIAAQLIQVSDQTHLWADSYEGNLTDIFAMQSRISREVAKQIQIKLVPDQTSARQVNAAAYEACLKARFLWSRRTEHDLQTSIVCFQEAIQCDPEFAPAYAGIADSYLALMDQGYLSPHQATAKATPPARKALELDETLAEPHVSLGHAALHDFDWPTAERELLRGIELNPNYSVAHFYYSNYLASMGRLEEAIAEADKARQLDPISPAVHSNLSTMFWLSGQYRRSIDQAKKSLELNPDYSGAYEDIGRAYEQLDEFDAAIEAFQKAATLAGRALGSLASLGHAYAVAGRRSEATKILSQLRRGGKTSFISAYYFAVVVWGLGRKAEALRWLSKAYEERSTGLPFLKVNPRFTSLHGDVRFQNLLRQVGLV